jgi:hypothetical protein
MDSFKDINDLTKKIPKTLMLGEERVSGSEYVDTERNNARCFFRVLQSFVPSLMRLRSSIEVDASLQEFASKYCQSESLTLKKKINKSQCDLFLQTYFLSNK